MYKAQLKRVRATRRALHAQQDMLHTMELEGLVGLTLYSMTGEVSLPLDASTASHLVDTFREMLHTRTQELKQQARGLRQDWAESKALAARDKELLRMAKKEQGSQSPAV